MFKPLILCFCFSVSISHMLGSFVPIFKMRKLCLSQIMSFGEVSHLQHAGISIWTWFLEGSLPNSFQGAPKITPGQPVWMVQCLSLVQPGATRDTLSCAGVRECGGSNHTWVLAYARYAPLISEPFFQSFKLKYLAKSLCSFFLLRIHFQIMRVVGFDLKSWQESFNKTLTVWTWGCNLQLASLSGFLIIKFISYKNSGGTHMLITLRVLEWDSSHCSLITINILLLCRNNGIKDTGIKD